MSGNNNTSKSTSWKVLETALSHLKGTLIEVYEGLGWRMVLKLRRGSNVSLHHKVYK